MGIEHFVAVAWAQKITDTVVQAAIAGLKRLRKQSGDDSCLQNAWEEFCFQVQGEHSFYWDAYLHVVDQILEAEVVELDEAERLALWLMTDAGWEWRAEHEDVDPEFVKPPVEIGEMVEYLGQELQEIAGNYESDTLEVYKYGSEALEDDEDDEDDEDEDEDEHDER